eukprot:CAMPEP_0195510604 /NCGR_PEP_ID=MMETSP0794_2-20130614/3204_1 /TAXON_ID=515487 /ORGANISM="Stephanopyxis turris, Strain CCMP 815" /LENGTH=298 /DNA_ID=CAMNT_0040638057 /DNA_START=184 /DNA_END=1080 /DNA_ORIENTATION=-
MKLDHDTVNLSRTKLNTSAKNKGETKIKQISIIGERNSGTTWITSHIQDCFGQHIEVKDSLVRYKHWFQHDVHEGKRVQDTVVIALFRNPYFWLEAMRFKAHHAPMHWRMSWGHFLKQPWTMERPKLDIELLSENNGTFVDSIPCQEGFHYNQIISCVKEPFIDENEFRSIFPKVPGKKLPGHSSHYPQYELRNDGSGAPYNSIMELRSDKIKNFLEIANWDWVRDIMIIQYESLLKNGTGFVISRIEQLSGFKAECKSYPSQKRGQRVIHRPFIHYVSKHLDWDAEELIGYEKIAIP